MRGTRRAALGALTLVLVTSLVQGPAAVADPSFPNIEVPTVPVGEPKPEQSLS